MSKTILVLYHAHCADGFGAALVAWQVFSDSAEYRAVAYGDPPPEIGEGIEEIYVLDFSYPAAVLTAWAERRKVVVLDHHATAEAELAKIGPRANLEIRFEREKSGAVMAWEWFRDAENLEGNPVLGSPPLLLLYIQDRDLWRWELAESREVSAALAARPREFRHWDALLWGSNSMEQLRHEGRLLLQMRNQMVEGIVQHASVIAIGNLSAPAVNTPVLQSEVCHRLLELYPEYSMAAAYFDKVTPAGGVRVWSLRSRPGFDCSKVAKVFGGGGHAQAAGFEQRFTVVHPAWTAPASAHSIGCQVYFGKECSCGCEAKGRETGGYHPDPEINAEVIQEATEGEITDLKAGYPPSRWICPQCSSSHSRGYFGTAPNHRCLKCGYTGSGGTLEHNPNTSQSDVATAPPV